MKKNIVFVIPTLRMGGAEKSLVSLLKSLDPDRINVDLFLFEAGGVLQQEIPQWVNIIEADPVTRGMTLEIRNYICGVVKCGDLMAASARIKISLQSRTGKKNQFSWGKIKKYIPTMLKNYDVAIGYLEGFADFFVLDKVYAKKKIGWIHIDYSGRVLLPEEIEYYNQFDNLVTISEICKKAFIKLVPEVENKMQVLENIVLFDEVKEKAKKSVIEKWNHSKLTHIVSVGRLEYQKGMDIAARASKVLADRKVFFCWHVYGMGIMQEEIEQYVKGYNLEDTFILEGLRENPYPYMKQADIIVQPSRWEGKSIVLDEAKILGKAIVVTNYPSVTDQIKDRVTGLITEMDPEAIADSVEEILNNSELKEQLERNALNEENSSYKVIEQFYHLLE